MNRTFNCISPFFHDMPSSYIDCPQHPSFNPSGKEKPRTIISTTIFGLQARLASKLELEKCRTALIIMIEYIRLVLGKMKTLLVYSTRYGGTAGTSEEIARVLREEGLGFDVKVLNAKEEKIEDISPYDLVIVGSGLQMDKWTGETEDFLKRFRKELSQKKVALFVSSAFVSLYKLQGKTAEVEQAKKKYLDEKADAYGLTPIATEIFGSVLDFNKMGFFTRKTLGGSKSSFESAGYKEKPLGVYDTRNWEEIKDWARKLLLKARYL